MATPQELYDAPVNAFVAGFIGDNNTLAGKSESGDTLRLPDGACLQARSAGALPSGSGATLCVRPEHLRLAGDADGMNRLQSTLVDAIHLGDHWRLVMRLAGTDTTWFAKLAPGAVPPGLTPGQSLPLTFHREHAWLFAG